MRHRYEIFSHNPGLCSVPNYSERKTFKDEVPELHRAENPAISIEQENDDRGEGKPSKVEGSHGEILRGKFQGK